MDFGHLARAAVGSVCYLPVHSFVLSFGALKLQIYYIYALRLIVTYLPQDLLWLLGKEGDKGLIKQMLFSGHGSRQNLPLGTIQMFKIVPQMAAIV